MDNTTTPLNEETAEEVIAGIESEPIRNLVRMAFAVARLRFAMRNGAEESSLPAAPFDMAFFASVLAEAFRSEETVRRVILGESIPTATGWDF
jgi:hypothetical protein